VVSPNTCSDVEFTALGALQSTNSTSQSITLACKADRCIAAVTRRHVGDDVESEKSERAEDGYGDLDWCWLVLGHRASWAALAESNVASREGTQDERAA
jgi:hypothetical protein